MGRVLAIDYGDQRIGLALSDPLKIIASPYKTIANKDNDYSVDAILEVIIDEDDTIIFVSIDDKKILIIDTLTGEIKNEYFTLWGGSARGSSQKKLDGEILYIDGTGNSFYSQGGEYFYAIKPNTEW